MLGGFIVIWSIASLLASAFQCDLPSAWMIVEGRCFDQVRYSTSRSDVLKMLNRARFSSFCSLMLTRSGNVEIEMKLMSRRFLLPALHRVSSYRFSSHFIRDFLNCRLLIVSATRRGF